MLCGQLAILGFLIRRPFFFFFLSLTSSNKTRDLNPCHDGRIRGTKAYIVGSNQGRDQRKESLSHPLRMLLRNDSVSVQRTLCAACLPTHY